MAKLLVTVEEARARLQISSEIDPPDLVSNLESAISASQLHVQSLLESNFTDTVGVTAIFYMDKQSFSNLRPEGVFRLYLQSGFVKPDTEQVFIGDKWNTCITPLDPADYSIDYEKGLVRVDEKHGDMFIRVVYDHGVTVATAPSWLKEAILAFLPVMLYMASTSEKTNPGIVIGEMKGHANAIMDAHRRKASFAIRAMR